MRGAPRPGAQSDWAGYRHNRDRRVLIQPFVGDGNTVGNGFLYALWTALGHTIDDTRKQATLDHKKQTYLQSVTQHHDNNCPPLAQRNTPTGSALLAIHRPEIAHVAHDHAAGVQDAGAKRVTKGLV